MPKILEDLRARLIEEAGRQLRTHGYRATTIRSVAQACSVATGTVYNYFSSKEELVASFLAEEWLLLRSRMERRVSLLTDAEQILYVLYEGITAYLEQNRALFSEDAAKPVYAASVSQRHPMLRGQLASLLFPLSERIDTPDPVFWAEFTAEALLTWTVAKKSFSDLFSLLKPLIKTKENPHEQL